ncbi:beta-amyrin 28-monooxygenase-like [Macadamia integrifolia]|uniref:beta-amyrin 28-monooxygenase-like n=1 Tax=Macadamia integrifolia TaxID=60698 RepID=UPI001C530AAF|nr:beta-amyrin 28-monooxygenase-like [Macadamia integrifolia]
MSFISLFLGAILVAFVFYFFSYFRSKIRNGQQDNTSLPPGNLGWPLLGETLEFLRTARNGMPGKFITDRMQKHSTHVFKTSLLGKPTAVFCGPEGNKFLFSNENKVVVTWWPTPIQNLFPSSIMASTGHDTKRMRKVFAAFFKPDSLQRCVGTMDAVTKLYLQSEWEGKGEVKVFPMVKYYTFSLACSLFTGIEDPEYISKLSTDFNILLKGIISFPLNFPGTRYNHAIRAANRLRKEFQVLIEQRRVDLSERSSSSSPKHDLLWCMLTTTDENGQLMTEKEVLDNILGMLMGGHDTTSCALTFLMKYLAELPHVYDEIFKEQMEILTTKEPNELLTWEDIHKMKHSWAAANEAMRLAPPVQGNFRKALSDFTYAGFHIPKGWTLYWSVNSTHMNPDYFQEPEKFNKSRFEGNGAAPYTFIPFGGGPRMCPGKEYAHLEILVFLHNVVKKFKWETVFPNEKFIVDPLPTPAEGLPILLHPH